MFLPLMSFMKPPHLMQVIESGIIWTEPTMYPLETSHMKIFLSMGLPQENNNLLSCEKSRQAIVSSCSDSRNSYFWNLKSQMMISELSPLWPRKMLEKGWVRNRGTCCEVFSIWRNRKTCYLVIMAS